MSQLPTLAGAPSPCWSPHWPTCCMRSGCTCRRPRPVGGRGRSESTRKITSHGARRFGAFLGLLAPGLALLLTLSLNTTQLLPPSLAPRSPAHACAGVQLGRGAGSLQAHAGQPRLGRRPRPPGSATRPGVPRHAWRRRRWLSGSARCSRCCCSRSCPPLGTSPTGGSSAGPPATPGGACAHAAGAARPARGARACSCPSSRSSAQEAGRGGCDRSAVGQRGRGAQLLLAPPSKAAAPARLGRSGGGGGWGAAPQAELSGDNGPDHPRSRCRGSRSWPVCGCWPAAAPAAALAERAPGCSKRAAWAGPGDASSPLGGGCASRGDDGSLAGDGGSLAPCICTLPLLLSTGVMPVDSIPLPFPLRAR